MKPILRLGIPLVVFLAAVPFVQAQWIAGGGSAVSQSHGDEQPPLLGGPRALSVQPQPEAVFTPRANAAGLTVNATFDSSITGNANAAAIESTINQAVAIYQSLFSDPITVNILFRYSTTNPDGSAIGSGGLATSWWGWYSISWASYVGALSTDAKTSNDTTANASLPVSALASSIYVTAPNGRALGFNTPSTTFANGTFGFGGPYDGIVTINSSQPWQWTRPTSGGSYDALRSIQHEMDEVMGLGALNAPSGALRPQDLFSWSAPGTRSLSTSGTRYFSINGGTTNIVGFNQVAGGDLGDWVSPGCPQANPYVQNAFSCSGQYADVTATSPEGINLDVIGYDLAIGSNTHYDFNGDGKADLVWRNGTTGDTWQWLMIASAASSSAPLGTVAPPWTLAAIADFDGDGKNDLVWRNTSTGDTWLWLMNGSTATNHLPIGNIGSAWSIAAAADFNNDKKADLVWRNGTTGDTWLWLMNGATPTSQAPLGTIAPPWTVAAAADLDNDGKADLLWRNTTTGDTWIWIMNGTAVLSRTPLGTIAPPWTLAAAADFNADGKGDLVWLNATTGDSWIWIMNGTAVTSRTPLATEPPPWTLAVAADFNGDGKADLVWRNATTGDTWMWLMNGTAPTSFNVVANPGTAYAIAKSL